MNPPVIHAIFPWPVFTVMLEREFSEEELAFAYSQECGWNKGGLIGKDRRVLDKPVLADLRAMIQPYLDLYVERIISPRDPIELYITQSWFNLEKKGMYHHQHSHTNSLVSGVIYIKTQPGDCVQFYRDNHRQILSIEGVSRGPFNSDICSVGVEAGELILFPSAIVHGVDPVDRDREEGRLSLAFNTFVRGVVGDEFASNALEIR